MFKTPILMLKMTFFWLLFRGKFEQKTQKSISFKNQWRLKNIKKAMVVKNIIAEDMPFTKSIFEQFWRSYCKKTIFVVFHFLKFLPKCISWSKSTLVKLREQIIGNMKYFAQYLVKRGQICWWITTDNVYSQTVAINSSTR